MGHDLSLDEIKKALNCSQKNYKILAKIVAMRMEPALPKQIIHSDQTGFIKGRYIDRNIRLLIKK